MGTAALLCAAVLLASGIHCHAMERRNVRDAVSAALERLGISLNAPIGVSTRPEGEAADVSVLEGCCVIGHSHAVGMQMNLDIPGLDYIAEVGMLAESMLYHQEFPLPGGGKGSLRMGLEAGDYKRIFVLLGSNDILGGSAHLPNFERHMEKLLDVLEEYQPEAEICLLSIAPLGESFYNYCSYNYGLTMETVEDYNYTLRSLAVERDIDYLDITTPLQGENGFLSAACDRGDGLHFSREGNEAILQTILTHWEE